MTDEIIHFPDPLDFDGMGIKIDIRARKNWNEIFKMVEIAFRFGNLDHVEAERIASQFIAAGDNEAIDETKADLIDVIDELRKIIKLMEVAVDRIEIAKTRVLRRERQSPQGEDHS